MYYQGPIVKDADLPDRVARLSIFRTEIHSQHPDETTGEMVDTPAITSLDGFLDGDDDGAAAAATGGGGRVVLNSPHPELSPNLPQIYTGELRWVARLAEE